MTNPSVEAELVDQSPRRTGRPMAIGQTLLLKDNQTEVSDLKEEVSIRFHLGYCGGCGRHVTAGYNKMGFILDQLEKRHFPRKRHRKPPLRARIGKFLMAGVKDE